jgi:hypothetical protein
MFSHGYLDSPINSNHYMLSLSVLASYGYIVVAPFHGDARFSNLRIDDLEDAIDVATNPANFTALQALRPLSISAALDLVLAHPQWRDHIDETQMAGSGGSMAAKPCCCWAAPTLTTSTSTLRRRGNRSLIATAIQGGRRYIPLSGSPPSSIRAGPARARGHQSAISRTGRHGGLRRPDP